MTEVDLSIIKDMIAAMARADARLRALEAEKDKVARARDQLREQASKLMGSADVGLVDGIKVLKRTQSKQFANARFKAENPDLYESVKTFDMVENVDKTKLEHMAPDVYKKYLTWRWTNTMEVADE